MINSYTLPFRAVSLSNLLLVGGKGANLGEMTKAGFPVPPGFCITTMAFDLSLAQCPGAKAAIEALEQIRLSGSGDSSAPASQLRNELAAAPLSVEIREAILAAWRNIDPEALYAVRSSATAEDLPGASFAGQQDTFLNIRGEEALLTAVRNCWASLFSERAVVYRNKKNFSHREVKIAVVIQRMIASEVSGILFTADPVSGHRQVISIDAGFGLGEALVSGIISPDLYKVDKRNLKIIEKSVKVQEKVIRPLPEGGTETVAMSVEEGGRQALSDNRILKLARLALEVEKHYGSPQDMEWAFENGELYMLQSRPITSLFPVPSPPPLDKALHLYLSFGHIQMMTEAMTPLALSSLRLLFPVGKPLEPGVYNPHICSAGGRLFMDMSPLLFHAPFRHVYPKALGFVEPLMGMMAGSVVNSREFKQRIRMGKKATLKGILRWIGPVAKKLLQILPAPEKNQPDFAGEIEKAFSSAQVRIFKAPAGRERLLVARDVLENTFPSVFYLFIPYFILAFPLRSKIQRLTGKGGEHPDIQAIERGFDGNITTEMDLHSGDLADSIKSSPALLKWFRERERGFSAEDLNELFSGSVPDSEKFLSEWKEFMELFGMRGTGEIDITRPRWREDPTPLLHMISGSLAGDDAGGHREHFERLKAEGEAASKRLAQDVKNPRKRRKVEKMIRIYRKFIAFREHPKYCLIRIIGLVRQVLMECADSLVVKGVLKEREDVRFFYFNELLDLSGHNPGNQEALIQRRKEEFHRFSQLKVPRVMSSDGFIPPETALVKDLPDGALSGLAVSPGCVEASARVITDPSRETLLPGEILVAPHTDPGWTPLFINAAAVVIEVGGMMTHGSVIAREYGIPGVVSVTGALDKIKTGQLLRVNGSTGVVEILD